MLAVRTTHTGGVCSTSLRDGGARSDPGMDHVERAGSGREIRGHDHLIMEGARLAGKCILILDTVYNHGHSFIYVSFDAF